MKIATITLSLLATANSGYAAYCHQDAKNEVFNFAIGYSVGNNERVPDVPGVCGGLWDNLNRFPDSVGVGEADCSEKEGGISSWSFINGDSCNRGMIESTWYEATRNQWGSITSRNG